ncbi:MAG: glucosamine-6-phosphate deaminase [Candidatus Ancillula sp.]|jgi:glucosamine-6-phosphate deaminase|nr:glucosamine-6-phosphate deaminase [Candidatus Ancillula sp.]
MAEVIICKGAQASSQAAQMASSVFIELFKRKATAVIGLATGSTPLKVYEHLAKEVSSQKVDVSHVQGFALDEYVGLEKSHPESYFSIIDKHVTKPIGFTPGLIHVPSGDIASIQTAGKVYEAMIRSSGGIDVQILGIGTDGHIGFNEPGSSLASRTRIKTLTQQTREDNARFFDSPDQVPLHCITQGIGTILEAKHVLLLAFGENKAEAVRDAIEGPVSALCPASALQLHPHATYIIDEAAASMLKLKDYYEYTFANKPDWQRI